MAASSLSCIRMLSRAALKRPAGYNFAIIVDFQVSQTADSPRKRAGLACSMPTGMTDISLKQRCSVVGVLFKLVGC